MNSCLVSVNNNKLLISNDILHIPRIYYPTSNDWYQTIKLFNFNGIDTVSQ